MKEKTLVYRTSITTKPVRVIGTIPKRPYIYRKYVLREEIYVKKRRMQEGGISPQNAASHLINNERKPIGWAVKKKVQRKVCNVTHSMMIVIMKIVKKK
jgi:hypothetical protein